MDQHRSNFPPLFRALVVDDSTTLRRLMELILIPLGAKIDFVDNGESAVELAKHNHYDIVLLDIMLPGIDGYRVCKTIKGDKRTRTVPIIMLTSMKSAIDKIRGMMAGTDAYLTKPVDRTELLRTIDKYLPHAELSLKLAKAPQPAMAAAARR
jgi:two-component system, cell cycle response regulator